MFGSHTVSILVFLTGAANENGKVAEDSETIPDQTPAVGGDAKPADEPAADAAAAASADNTAAAPPAAAEAQPAADSPPAEAAAPAEASAAADGGAEPAAAAPEQGRVETWGGDCGKILLSAFYSTTFMFKALVSSFFAVASLNQLINYDILL